MRATCPANLSLLDLIMLIISFMDSKIREMIIKENTDTLSDASRDIGLEINAEKTKYMIMTRHPNSGQNQNIRIGNGSFENVAKFKYLGTMLTNKNEIRDEIKSRLNSGNACYY
jgi:hypothetical protein